MQVKPSKRAKKNKPSEEPVVAEPLINASAPDNATHQPPPDPASNIPVPTSDPPTEDILHTSDPETPSPVKTKEPEVEIVWRVSSAGGSEVGIGISEAGSGGG